MGIFKSDIFEGVGGGGGPEPIYTYNFADTPTVALLISNLFESDKSYKIIVKGSRRNSSTGTFSVPSFDLEKPDGTFGVYKTYIESNRTTSTSKSTFSGSNSGSISAGILLDAVNLTDFEITVFYPRTSTVQTRARLDVHGWGDSGEAQRGWALMSSNTVGADEFSGIKVFASGNSLIDAGTLEVFEI